MRQDVTQLYDIPSACSILFIFAHKKKKRIEIAHIVGEHPKRLSVHSAYESTQNILSISAKICAMFAFFIATFNILPPKNSIFCTQMDLRLTSYEISSFRLEVDENCVLLWRYAASSSKFLLSLDS